MASSLPQFYQSRLQSDKQDFSRLTTRVSKDAKAASTAITELAAYISEILTPTGISVNTTHHFPAKHSQDAINIVAEITCTPGSPAHGLNPVTILLTLNGAVGTEQTAYRIVGYTGTSRFELLSSSNNNPPIPNGEEIRKLLINIAILNWGFQRP